MLPVVPTDTCAVLSRLLALSMEASRQLTENTQNLIVAPQIMALLLRGLKQRDPSILLHSQRIAAVSSGVAGLLGWDNDQRRQLEVAALLHDLGKLGIPEHILRKPGKLSSEEYDFVLLHHHAAVNLLQALHVDPLVVTMLSMLYHSFDGGSMAGEDGLVPQELPLGARILAVADAYDSLNSAKPYRRGMTHQEVMRILEEKSGSRYDGNVVRTLGRWYEAEGDILFRHSDPFHGADAQGDITESERKSIITLTQILNVLYQFQQLYDGYFILDAAECYSVWSDGMPGLTGLHMTSVLGRAWHPSDVQLSSVTLEQVDPEAKDETAVAQVLKNCRPQFSSRLCRSSEGRHFKVDVYTLPVQGPNGRPLGVVQLLRNKSGVRRQSREYVELKLAATRDPLTGVANRGQLETHLRHLLEDFHVNEATRPLSIIFLDVDRFKKINDTYGHQSGDDVLVDLTRLLQHETYSGEIIGRYGGEEFVMLCPDADLEAAVRRAERLRVAVMKSSVGGISTLNVTSSFGVSTARFGDSVQTLMERADNCLYRAKESGRNRTCWEGQGESIVEEETLVDEAVPQFTMRDGRFEYRDTVEVSTSLELTAMKLRAFLQEFDVDILSQAVGEIRFRLGSLGLTRRWGGGQERQPLEIELRFESVRTVSKLDGKPKTVRMIHLLANSYGKVPDMETFVNRCNSMIRELRAYLLGS